MPDWIEMDGSGNRGLSRRIYTCPINVENFAQLGPQIGTAIIVKFLLLPGDDRGVSPRGNQQLRRVSSDLADQVPTLPVCHRSPGRGRKHAGAAGFLG